MTPEEIKAKELIDTFKKIKGAGKVLSDYAAKQCALICVDRNIKLLRELQEQTHSDLFFDFENAILDEEELNSIIEEQ